ncbi:MAG: CHAT domain-containing protein, partial [Bacteroidota bacterium]
KKQIESLEKSLDVYKEVETVIDRLFQRWEGYQPIFRESWLEHYENIINTQFLLDSLTDDSKYLADALRISEKGKAAYLSYLFNESNAREAALIPIEMRKKERSILNQIIQRERQLDNVGKGAIEKRKEVMLELFKLREERDEFIDSLELLYPKYQALKRKTNTITPKQIQTDILSDNQSLIEYFVGDQHLYIFLIQKDNYEVKRLDMDFPVKDWIDRIILRMKKESIDDYDYFDEAHLLYQKLISPIESYLTQNEELVIIPDGELNRLPFNLLLREMPLENSLDNHLDHSYLALEYVPSFCYSASLLYLMKQQEFDTKYRRRDYLGIAPDFSKALKFSPLKENMNEAKIGKQILQSGDVLLGKNATKRKVVESLPRYKIINFSTHGFSSDGITNEPILILGGENGGYDTLAYSELFTLDLNAELVILSACETQAGILQGDGEGLINLTRGFSYAGSKTVIANLWSANEAYSLRFWELFYQEIKEGVPKNRALNNSIRKMMNGIDRAPYFWAGFMLVGDIDSIEL